MSAAGPALVVFSSLFPSEQEPLAGVFIRERMFRVAKVLPVTLGDPSKLLCIEWHPSHSATPPEWNACAGPAIPIAISAAASTTRPTLIPFIFYSSIFFSGGPAVPVGPVGFVPPPRGGFTFFGGALGSMRYPKISVFSFWPFPLPAHPLLVPAVCRGLDSLDAYFSEI